jgi:hypothetical protein
MLHWIVPLINSNTDVYVLDGGIVFSTVSVKLFTAKALVSKKVSNVNGICS